MSKMKQVGWNDSTKSTGFWRQDEDEDEQVSGALCSNCTMEGTMTLVAEVVLLCGIENAARCSSADICLVQRVAIQRLPGRIGRSGVERSNG